MSDILLFLIAHCCTSLISDCFLCRHRRYFCSVVFGNSSRVLWLASPTVSGVAKGGSGGICPPLAENPELHCRLTGVAEIAIKYSTKVHNVTIAALNNMQYIT